jgi:hypothetical protein
MSQVTITKEMLQALNLNESANAETVIIALKNLAATAAQVPVLEAKAKSIEAAILKSEVDEILLQAKNENKVTPALQALLEANYATNPDGLRSLIAAMPAYQSTANLSGYLQRQATDEENWTWEDYEKKDPAGKKLRELKASDPETYQRLYTERYFKPKENWHRDIAAARASS